MYALSEESTTAETLAREVVRQLLKAHRRAGTFALPVRPDDTDAVAKAFLAEGCSVLVDRARDRLRVCCAGGECAKRVGEPADSPAG